MDGVIAAQLTLKIISGQHISSDKSISSYVEVDLYGIPTDTMRKEHKTKVTQNNSLNPIYDQGIRSEGFHIRKLIVPELALVRFMLYESKENGGKTLIGQRTIPFNNLKNGYRHIMLRTVADKSIGLCSLFVKLDLKTYVPEDMCDFVFALQNPKEHLKRHEKTKSMMIAAGAEDLDMQNDDNIKNMIILDKKNSLTAGGAGTDGLNTNCGNGNGNRPKSSSSGRQSTGSGGNRPVGRLVKGSEPNQRGNGNSSVIKNSKDKNSNKNSPDSTILSKLDQKVQNFISPFIEKKNIIKTKVQGKSKSTNNCNKSSENPEDRGTNDPSHPLPNNTCISSKKTTTSNIKLHDNVNTYFKDEDMPEVVNIEEKTTFDEFMHQREYVDLLCELQRKHVKIMQSHVSITLKTEGRHPIKAETNKAHKIFLSF